MGELRRYGVLLAPGAAGSTPIVLDLRKAADGRLAGSADWTPVPGDTTVSIDEGTGANITTVPAFVAGRWHIVLTAAELTGKSIMVRVVDQDGPVIQDTLVEVQTFGSSAAYYPDNYSAQLLPSALVGGRVDANMGAISTDAAAADNLETMLDGTGGQVLSLGQLNIVNSGGSALVATSTGGNGNGILATGNGTGAGLLGQAGATGSGIFGRGGASGGSGGVFQAQGGTGQPGLNAVGFGTGAGVLGSGGATGGAGIRGAGGTGSGVGIQAAGAGTGAGLQATGGATGIGMEAVGGSGSGNAAQFTAAPGSNSVGVRAVGSGSGAGVYATGGDIGHGIHAQGGTNTGDGVHFQAQTVGDGMELVAAGGGLPLNPAVSGGSGGSTAAEIADAVWDEPKAFHNTPNTFGDYLDVELSTVTGAMLAQRVWDEPLAGHNTAGTAGEAAAAARAQAYGKWVIAGDALTLYAADGTTVVKTFTLSPAGGPYTTRTPA